MVTGIPEFHKLTMAESIALLLRVSEHIERLTETVFADSEIPTGVTLEIVPASGIGGTSKEIYRYLDAGLLVFCIISRDAHLRDTVQISVVHANGASRYSRILTEDSLKQFAVDSKKHIKLFKELISKLKVLGRHNSVVAKIKVQKSVEDELREAIESVKRMFNRR